MALGVPGVVLQLLLNIRRLLGKEGVAVLTE
jgi:methane/ammonia monooxygenase subunit C